MFKVHRRLYTSNNRRSTRLLTAQPQTYPNSKLSFQLPTHGRVYGSEDHGKSATSGRIDLGSATMVCSNIRYTFSSWDEIGEQAGAAQTLRFLQESEHLITEEIGPTKQSESLVWIQYIHLYGHEEKTIQINSATHKVQTD